MADIKLSGIGITAINGSVGDTTFSRNYYGTYAKKRKAAPASTPALVSWQAIIKTFGKYWVNSMSDAQRNEWYQWKLPFKDDLADTHMLTGFDLFMNFNLSLQLIGSPALPRPDPPNYNQSRILQAWPLTSFTGQSAVVGQVAFSANWIGAVNSLAIYATPAMSLGRMSFSQVYTYICPAIGTIGTFDITAQYALRMLPAISGTKIFIKAIPINPELGVRLPASCCSLIIS